MTPRHLATDTDTLTLPTDTDLPTLTTINEALADGGPLRSLEGPDGSERVEATTAQQSPERSQAVGVAPAVEGTTLARVLDVAGWLAPRFYTRDDMRKATRRRALPIHAYVGANGSGKSLSAVHDSLISLDNGRRVLSTVRLLDYRNPRPCPGGLLCDDPAGHHVYKTVMRPHPDDDRVMEPHTYDTGRVHAAAHPLYVPFTDMRQLLEWRDGDVFMDEVMGIASSRESASMPPEIGNKLLQLRRANILLRWTAPSWLRADIVIRECTQAVTDCTGFLAIKRVSPDGTMVWRDRRLMRWDTYDAMAFDEWSQSKKDDLEPLITQRFWRPGSVTERAYDTNDAVSSVTQVSPHGTCLNCGGTRARVKCSCDTHREGR